MQLFPASPRPVSLAARLAAASFTLDGETRPLTREEFDHARYIIRRWKSARGFVASRFGHSDETEEYQDARDRYETWEGTEAEYLAAAETDGGLIPPDQLQSYAAYSAGLYDDGSIEQATWLMLRAAEIDLIRFVDALANAGFWERGHSVDSLDRPALTLDGKTFAFHTLDDHGPEDDRLVVEDAAHDEVSEAGDVLDGSDEAGDELDGLDDELDDELDD